MESELMKKANARKKKFLLLLPVVLAGLAILLCIRIFSSENSPLRETKRNTETPYLAVQIETEGGSETILPQWEKQNCTIYLPSFASNTSMRFVTEDTVLINDVAAEEAEDFLKDGSYCLKADGREYDLTILTSANTGTIFIHTASGGMDDLYADATYKEGAELTVFTDSGTLDYQNDADKIRIRGNSTSSPDKKSFNLKLDSESSLLGLREQKEFALLANPYDRSGLRDVLYKETAEEMGFAYTPDTEYTDVYLNGEYNGLYVLSEKAADSAADLSLPKGSFLCAIELSSNMKEGDVYTESLLQDIFEIFYPEDPSVDELEEISSHLNALERTLLSEDGMDEQSGKFWKEMIDMESWAKAYVIDEVFANVDAAMASSYLYYNASDGLLYKGPIWDGDRILGNQSCNANPQTLLAADEYGYNGYATVYYAYLLKKEEFREAVKKVYQDYDFRTLINERIDENSSLIEVAKALDDHRWDTMYQELEDSWEAEIIVAEDMKSYVDTRVTFLDRVIPDLENYAIIYEYTKGRNYHYTTVKKGDTFTPDDTTVKYVHMDTGKIVDFTQPIYDNLAIQPYSEEE